MTSEGSARLGKAAALAATALLSTAVTACGNKSVQDDDEGTLSIHLHLGPGLDIDTFDTVVSGNGMTPATGTIDVSADDATVHTTIPGLPEGVGYRIELHGVSTDGATTCDGSSSFDIAAGAVTQTTVLLICNGATTGSVVVDGVFCPGLTSFSADPGSVPLGATIDVAAMARDLDTSDDATPTYAWTATAGSFASPASGSTTYACSAAGTQTLTIKVSATSPTRNVTACDVHGSATVTCVAPVCGNNIIEAGEDCDPPNGTTCDASCHTISAFCGDGVINAPGEECEPPNEPATSYGYGCDASCRVTDSLCHACELTKCDALFGDAGAWGCANLSGTAKANCEALLSCIRTSHCAAATQDAQGCYCGTAADLGCLTGSANGACKAQYEAAAGTTDPATIANVFTDPSSPVGLANNQITCDADTSTPPNCTSACPL